MIKQFLEKECVKLSVLGIALLVLSSFLTAFYPQYPFVYLWVLSIIITVVGILFFIGSVVTRKDPWGIFSFLIILIAVMISYLMISNYIDPKDVQALLSTYITIETAILSVIFGIIAIKPSIHENLKTDVDNSIIFAVSFLLITIIIYCISFIAESYVKNPLTILTIFIWPISTFNILWAIATFSIFVLIANFMLLIVKIFRIRVNSP